MSTPQPANGMREQGLVKVRMAAKMLEQALPMVGSDSEDGKCVLEVLSKLSKKYGKTDDKTDQLMPGELKQLQDALGGGPGGQKPPGAGPRPNVPMPQMPQ
jgi:hypothetical protein